MWRSSRRSLLNSIDPRREWRSSRELQGSWRKMLILLLIILLMDFELIFEKLGRFNYNNRAIVVMGTLTIFLLFSLGLLNIRLETDPQSLWVSHNSVGY